MTSFIVPIQRIVFLLLLLIIQLPQLYLQRLIDFTSIDPACDTMIPTINRNILGTTNESNFRIRVFDEDGKETYEYDVKNRRILYVKVEGGPFVRAHIQARSVAYPTIQVGNFVAPPPEYFKLVNCSGIYGAAIINEDHVTRRHTSVRWRPPRIAKGAIVFLASIIRSKKLFHIRSAFLSPYTNLITVKSDECGRSHGCLRAGDDRCTFADTCRFSLKWRCYKDSMIVDAVHSGKLKSFGLSTSNNRGVICVSRPNYVIAEDYIIVSGNGFPNIFEISRSISLKAIRDSRRVYCRFEMERPKINSTDFIYGEIDEYGHPYKLKRWKIPVTNMCDPRYIHSTEGILNEDSLAQRSSTSGAESSLPNAHFIAFITCSLGLMQYL